MAQQTDLSVRPGSVKHRTLLDVFDAQVLQDLIRRMPAEQQAHITYLMMVSDGAEVQKDTSWTPVTAKILN